MARNDAPSAREIDGMLQRLEQRIDTLKKRYRRYFLGIDRRPPIQMRKRVVREVFELEQTFINNTAQKFKLRSLVQTFNTHKTKWNRIMRQIEQGTYKRDRHKAKRRERQRRQRQQNGEQEGGEYELNLEEDFIDDLQEIDLDAVLEQPAGREPSMPGQKQRASTGGAPSSSTRREAAPQQSNSKRGGRSAAEKERIKKQRLAEIQRKLQMGEGNSPSPPANSSRGGRKDSAQSSDTNRVASKRKQKLQAMRRKLERQKKSK